jgi:fucose 4-O-acetylase-like acetyltransferase
VPIAPRSPALKLIAAVAALAAGAGFCALNGPVSYNNMIYHNYFLLYLAAFGGIIGYALIAQLLHEFKPLLFLGRNTLLIFGFHLAGYHVINRILRFARVSTDLTVLWGFAYAAACVALLLPLIYFLNRYLPFAVGKQKQRPASEFAEVKAK